jgi:hypothetical protein
MKRFRMISPFLALIAAFGLTACPIHSGNMICKIDNIPEKKFAGLDQKTMEEIQSYEVDFGQDIATHEQVVSDECCDTFISWLAGQHCTPRIERYCAENCASAEESAACIAPDRIYRTKLLERCLHDVYDEFVMHAPTCKRMHLGQDPLKPTWTFGDGRTARCPATAAPTAK